MIFIVFFLFACEFTNQDSPRVTYNEGIKQLSEQQLDEAAIGFLSARDEAKSDSTLRQFSAYNLALTHALQGGQYEAEDPEKASQEYTQSISWFRDAVRLNPADEDARYNLEVVLKKAQGLAKLLICFFYQ